MEDKLNFEILYATVSDRRINLSIRFTELEITLCDVTMRKCCYGQEKGNWDLLLKDDYTRIEKRMKDKIITKILERLKPYIPPEKV